MSHDFRNVISRDHYCVSIAMESHLHAGTQNLLFLLLSRPGIPVGAKTPIEVQYYNSSVLFSIT